ncbi:MAG TPA: hypothetical protein VGX25_10120 [Actinophytocola sp.]|uniref:hypothetical protein n=1 Tax=Actinophytocola sp. TaxID=1872138 RepID=UPI002DDCDE5C|nr:hypothetical protein [Actinophytocola sp.]HEV2779744.1 hypothetical protein [Actinophytocola sp.]
MAPIPRIVARRLRLAALSALGQGIARNSWADPAGIAGTARRALCVAVDIKNWSGRPVPEQIQAQHALVTAVRTACAAAGLPGRFAQVNGDGVLVIAPSGIDETRAIPALIQGLRVALHHQNRILSEGARARLRVALTEGIIASGPAGVGGRAVIECFRLLNSPPVRQALDESHAGDLAVIVSDHLYRDVIEHGFHGLPAYEFQPTDCSIPDKEFHTRAWVYAPGSAMAV